MMCRYFIECDRLATHVVHEPAEYDEDHRDVIAPAFDRPLCPAHARAYDRMHRADVARSERLEVGA